MNAYWDITATGGSGYTFDLALSSDSAILGNVSSPANLKLAHYSGTATDWNAYSATNNHILGNFLATGLPATWGIFTGTDGTSRTLPVNLLSFKASLQKEDVLLTWRTSSEINANSFIVERSADNKTWETAGTVTAKGNSNSVTNYQLTDFSPFKTTNSLYYRLQIVDSDGSFDYSKVVSVNREQQIVQSLTAYPNPFNNSVSIEFVSVSEGTANIHILDITGRDVQLNTSKQIVKGNNVLSIDTEKLNGGIYFLSVELNGEKQIVKLIKQ